MSKIQSFFQQHRWLAVIATLFFPLIIIGLAIFWFVQGIVGLFLDFYYTLVGEG